MLAEKELESRLKADLLKKISITEKEALVRQYMGLGMRRDACLSIAQLSKHQFYQPLSGQRVGRQGTTKTRRKDMVTSEVI